MTRDRVKTRLSIFICLIAVLSIALFASPIQAYMIDVNIVHGDPGPFPDWFEYTVKSEAGDQNLFDFHLDFLPLDIYATKTLPNGWQFLQDKDGVHWYNLAKDNPIVPGAPGLTFTLALSDSISQFTAYSFLTTSGRQALDPADTVAFNPQIPVPANLVLLGPGEAKSKVKTTTKIMNPNFWQIDTKGEITYKDDAGVAKQGIWTMQSKADDKDNDGKWDYEWVLTNVPGLPGGLPFGNMIGYDDNFPFGYPEDLANVMVGGGAARSAKDKWGDNIPGGFDGMVTGANPLTPGDKATVDLTGAPAPLLAHYWTRWNPPSDSIDMVYPTPEPSTLLLLGSGVAGIIGFGRKRYSTRNRKGRYTISA